MSPPSKINLVSVNSHPEHAFAAVPHVIENLKDKYSIVHVANVESIEDVKPVLRSLHPKPDLLFAASTWSEEEQGQIIVIAKDSLPSIKTNAIPSGLQDRMGEAAIVKYVTESISHTLGSP